jgi:ankyrin repeat protein
MEATIKGHLSIVKLLLKYDADINGSDNNHCTALIEASSKGHFEIAKLLSDDSKGALLVILMGIQLLS